MSASAKKAAPAVALRHEQPQSIEQVKTNIDDLTSKLILATPLESSGIAQQILEQSRLLRQLKSKLSALEDTSRDRSPKLDLTKQDQETG
jgi:hypothetical protein